MADPQGFTVDARERLKQHFSVPYEQHSNRWDDLWKTGDFLPWDRNEPNPALGDALAERQKFFGNPVAADGSRRKRALVPGCGMGYDVLLLASFGYDAYGLEISENAIKAAQAFAKTNFDEYARRAPKGGAGTYKFILGNFFEDDWMEGLGMKDQGFDLIYDYTFLCALPPETRPAWALRHTQLLMPVTDSRLICIEFPSYKEPHTGGPPHGVKPETYIAHLSRPGEKVPYTAEGYPDKSTYADECQNEIPALRRIDHWKAERTHPVGQGTDFVSIWGHD